MPGRARVQVFYYLIEFGQVLNGPNFLDPGPDQILKPKVKTRPNEGCARFLSYLDF